jgi:hypothetical protein
MGATKKWSVIMSDADYCEIPYEMRLRFPETKALFEDYEIYKDNPIFKKLYKAKKKATKDLDIWKYEQRQKQ